MPRPGGAGGEQPGEGEARAGWEGTRGERREGRPHLLPSRGFRRGSERSRGRAGGAGLSRGPGGGRQAAHRAGPAEQRPQAVLKRPPQVAAPHAEEAGAVSLGAHLGMFQWLRKAGPEALVAGTGDVARTRAGGRRRAVEGQRCVAPLRSPRIPAVVGAA